MTFPLQNFILDLLYAPLMHPVDLPTFKSFWTKASPFCLIKLVNIFLLRIDKIELPDRFYRVIFNGFLSSKILIAVKSFLNFFNWSWLFKSIIRHFLFFLLLMIPQLLLVLLLNLISLYYFLLLSLGQVFKDLLLIGYFCSL